MCRLVISFRIKNYMVSSNIFTKANFAVKINPIMERAGVVTNLKASENKAAFMPTPGLRLSCRPFLLLAPGLQDQGPRRCEPAPEGVLLMPMAGGSQIINRYHRAAVKQRARTRAGRGWSRMDLPQPKRKYMEKPTAKRKEPFLRIISNRL